MTEPQAATVHPATLPDDVLRSQCEETRTRRGGPGGQHRNKVETAVVLRHRPTGLAAEACERRSQDANRRVALERLRLVLALEVRLPPATGPSALWRGRTRGGRLVVAADHADVAALVAEAFDQLVAREWHVPEAAAALGVTPSQLVRFLRRTPAAWVRLTRARQALGLPPLQ